MRCDYQSGDTKQFSEGGEEEGQGARRATVQEKIITRKEREQPATKPKKKTGKLSNSETGKRGERPERPKEEGDNGIEKLTKTNTRPKSKTSGKRPEKKAQTGKVMSSARREVAKSQDRYRNVDKETTTLRWPLRDKTVLKNKD